MKYKFFSLFVITTFVSCFGYGETLMRSSEDAYCCDPSPCCEVECGKAFITVGGGYSWSTKSHIKADSLFWDPAPQGYNRSLDQSEFYTFGLGYHCKSLLSFVLEVDYRPNYRYSKFQTSTATTTVAFIGTKTRKFRLSNLTFTANVFLNKSGNCYNWDCGSCFNIAPFIGGGIGVAYNTLYDFHSVLPLQAGQTVQEVRSIMNYRQKTAFAGQVMVGITSKINERMSIDLGYRWFYGGRFESNNYITNANPAVPTDVPPHLTPPWKGSLAANELYVCLNYNL